MNCVELWKEDKEDEGVVVDFRVEHRTQNTEHTTQLYCYRSPPRPTQLVEKLGGYDQFLESDNKKLLKTWDMIHPDPVVVAAAKKKAEEAAAKKKADDEKKKAEEEAKKAEAK